MAEKSRACRPRTRAAATAAHTPLHPLHTVAAPAGCNALSARYIGPLLGNGALSFFLDENGAMHDFAAFPGWPAPRVYWAGRRTADAQRRMVPFGYFTLAPSWEWMESTRWEQSLDVRRGLVTTVHERGAAREETVTLLALDRNLVALRKSVRGIRGAPSVTLRYRLCPPGAPGLPEGVTLAGGGCEDGGAWLGYRLNGVVPCDGRVAVWADRPGEAAWQDNELRLRVTLRADDEVTFYIALADDLGDEMFYRHTGWGGRHADHPMLAPVLRDLRDRPVTRGDASAVVRNLRAWTNRAGWRGVARHQARQWAEFWSAGELELPDAPEVQAVWETGMYAVRTQLTAWSIPVAIHGNYFNGQYFPDELAGAKALLQAGHWRLVERIAEHKRSVLPLGMQMVDGAGARLDAATYEGGHFTVAPMGCQVYEVHATAEPPRLIAGWLRYAGAPRAALERYYPVFWGAAEFFRRWMIYRGPDGKYFTGACVDFNESIPAVRNGAATVSGAIAALTLAADVAERLGCDAALARDWRELAAGLQVDVPTNSRGLLAQYDGDEGSAFTTLRLVAGPFNPAGIPATDPRVRRTLEAAVRDCKTRENWAVACSADRQLAAGSQDVHNPDPVAWTWLAAEAVGVAALLGDGELALQIASELIRCANAFVTSSAELSAALPLLLLRCETERLMLFPAVPRDWRTFAFRLGAPNRTTVQARVREGILHKLAIDGPPGVRRVWVPQRFQPALILGVPRRTVDGGAEYELRPGAWPCRPN